mgnify:CR=1 FL=1
MKYIIAIIITSVLAGCSMTYRLEQKKSRAIAQYTPKETAEQKRKEIKNYIEVKRDSAIFYLAPSVTDENGEQMMSLSIDEVVVVAKSRTLPERKGKVMIDFVITLPKELQGNCQSVSVIPWLHKFGKDVPLQELSIRGGLFSRVQKRNYWQFERYKEVFNPDSVRLGRAFEKFIKYPYPEGVRLDSIVENRGKISYFYTQEVSTQGEGKKMLITLQGAVLALDGSSYRLPPADTLQYNISSMLSFIDTTTRYVTRVIEKYAVVNDRNHLSFKVNSTAIIDTLGGNSLQLERIENLMDKLINQYEFHVDSIILTASASPEGTFQRNATLAKERAYSLRKYLVGKFGDEVDSLICVKWIAEDWDELQRLIGKDECITNKEGILAIIRSAKEQDKRETMIKTKFPTEYRYIKENLYPLLRSVNFKYDLRRVGMVKDTIHTTEPDTLYARGVELLESRQYLKAISILGEYKDRNSAITLMSLGYDAEAYAVLLEQPATAKTEYLKAVLCSRLGKTDEGRELFIRACNLDETLEYRGKLDPEISKLLEIK